MTVGMGDDIIGGKKHIFRISREEVPKGFTGMHEGFFRMAEGAVIANRRRKDVEGHFASMFCEKLCHLVNFINITTGKGIYKYCPFIALIVFCLLEQHPPAPLILRLVSSFPQTEMWIL